MKSVKEKIKTLVDGVPFQTFIFIIITINLILFGLETSSSFNETTIYVLQLLDNICLGIFIVELLLRFAADGFSFFKSKWNIFDFVIIILSLIPFISFFSLFRSFRILRIVRTAKTAKTLKITRSMRLVSGIESLRKITRAMVISLPSIFWTLVLMLIIYYIYAICGINLFGEAFPEYFGNLRDAFYTLFELMTLDNWVEIAKVIISKYSFARIYFISFLLIASYMILNIVVGIVVDSMAEARKETEKKPADLESLKEELAKLKEQIAKVEEMLED